MTSPDRLAQFDQQLAAVNESLDRLIEAHRTAPPVLGRDEALATLALYLVGRPHVYLQNLLAVAVQRLAGEPS